MTSDNVILVAGGDLRQQYAARRLRQKTGADVWTLGLPASPDGTTVPAPFGKAALPLETLAAHGKPGALVLGGACGGILPWLESRGLAAADYLRREELCLANAVPSAEGAIQIAMEETARTLHGTAALVIGYGRIGMALAPRLRGLGM